MTDPAPILVGIIGAPHGVQGELRFKSFTAEPLGIKALGALSTSDGSRRFTITKARHLKDDMLVVRLSGVDDRTQAQALTNVRLYVDREQLPEADEDEFYHADLVGLRAERSDGTTIGHIVAVQNFGAGDLLEIAPDAGDTLLIPFTKVFVPIVDLRGGRVVASDEALAEGEPAAEADGDG